MISRMKLHRAMYDLENLHGYFAPQKAHWCCSTCGWAAIPDDNAAKVCFYHEQDRDGMLEGHHMYLAWAGDGHLIKKVLEQHGLTVEWSGTNTERIRVKA